MKIDINLWIYQAEVKISNPECTNYNELNDATRRGTYGVGIFTDWLKQDVKEMGFTSNGLRTTSSPDWKGPAWYRVVEPAGSKLLSGDPGTGHCNTDDPGIIPEICKFLFD